MVSEIAAKLIEITADEVRPDLAGHEIEDRLLNHLLGKRLQFTTAQGTEGGISFHSLGRGQKDVTSAVSLQVEGIEFDQQAPRLQLDLRYIYYTEYGHPLFLGTPVKFLVTSPIVQKLGPSNILIEFVVYGNTVHRVNRCLNIFAKVIKQHQSDLHQRAISEYNETAIDTSDDVEISLDGPISGDATPPDYMEISANEISDEHYIKQYIDYLRDTNGGFRQTVDSKNTYASSKLE